MRTLLSLTLSLLLTAPALAAPHHKAAPAPAPAAPAAPQYDQPKCAPQATMAGALLEKYQEKPSAYGLSKSNTVTIIYASEAGTWTEVVLMPSGMACVVDVGDNWTLKAPESKGDGGA